jgi:hypothetical protein
MGSMIRAICAESVQFKALFIDSLAFTHFGAIYHQLSQVDLGYIRRYHAGL